MQTYKQPHWIPNERHGKQVDRTYVSTNGVAVRDHVRAAERFIGHGGPGTLHLHHNANPESREGAHCAPQAQPLLTEASAVVTSMAGCTTPNFAWMPLVSISISWRRMEN